MSFQGFGEPSTEFWLGNEFVSQLTVHQSYKLRIQLSDWDGNSGFSQYDQFSLDSEAQNYRYVVLTASKKLIFQILGGHYWTLFHFCFKPRFYSSCSSNYCYYYYDIYLLLSYNCAFEVCYSEHKKLTTMLLTTLWSNSPWNKTHCWTNKISEAPSFEKTSSWSEMLTSFYYFKAKHITEMIVDGGSLLYKSIYFLILMYWQEPKENVIKLVNV